MAGSLPGPMAGPVAGQLGAVGRINFGSTPGAGSGLVGRIPEAAPLPLPSAGLVGQLPQGGMMHQHAGMLPLSAQQHQQSTQYPYGSKGGYAMSGHMQFNPYQQGPPLGLPGPQYHAQSHPHLGPGSLDSLAGLGIGGTSSSLASQPSQAKVQHWPGATPAPVVSLAQLGSRGKVNTFGSGMLGGCLWQAAVGACACSTGTLQASWKAAAWHEGSTGMLCRPLSLAGSCPAAAFSTCVWRPPAHDCSPTTPQPSPLPPVCR